MGKLERVEEIESWANDQYDDLASEFEWVERDAASIQDSDDIERMAAEIQLCGRVLTEDLLERVEPLVAELQDRLDECERRWEAVEDTAIRRLPVGYEDYIALSDLHRSRPGCDVVQELASDIEAVRESVDTESEAWAFEAVDVSRKLLKQVASDLFADDAAWFIDAYDERDGRPPAGVLMPPPMSEKEVTSRLIALYESLVPEFEMLGDRPVGEEFAVRDEVEALEPWLSWLGASVDFLGLDSNRTSHGAQLSEVLSTSETATVSVVVDAIEGWIPVPATRAELVEAWVEAADDEEERWRRNWLHRQWQRRGQCAPSERPDVPMSPAMQARQLEKQRAAEEAKAVAKQKARERKRAERERCLQLLEQLAECIGDRADRLDVELDRKKLVVVATGEFDSVTLKLLDSDDVGYETAKSALSGDIAFEDIAGGVLDPILKAL